MSSNPSSSKNPPNPSKSLLEMFADLEKAAPDDEMKNRFREMKEDFNGLYPMGDSMGDYAERSSAWLGIQQRKFVEKQEKKPVYSPELQKKIDEMMKATVPHQDLYPPSPAAGENVIPTGRNVTCICTTGCTKVLYEPEYRKLTEEEMKRFEIGVEEKQGSKRERNHRKKKH